MKPAPGDTVLTGRQRKDPLGVVLGSDEAVTMLLGWRPIDLVGRRVLDFLHPDDLDPALDAWMAMLRGEADGAPLAVRHRHADGQYVDVELVNHNRLDTDGHVLSELRPATPGAAARRSAAAAGAASVPAGLDTGGGAGAARLMPLAATLASSHEGLLRSVLEALPSGVVQVGMDGRVVLANAAAERLLGPAPRDLAAVVARVVPDDRPLLRAALDDARSRGASRDVCVRVPRPVERSPAIVALGVRVLREQLQSAPVGMLLTLEDVTESVRVREQLEARATRDALTGAANRATAFEALQRALSHGDDVAAVFVDLDEFKAVNDTHGHGAGDRVLTAVADAIGGVVRGGDVVGRFGGDEFVVVCPGIPTADAALALAGRVHAALPAEVAVHGRSVRVSSSVGVAHARGRKWDAEALLAACDQAMYRAKRSGATGPVLYADQG